jgi:WhiB family redox-sensing transcriptional regulator
VSCTEPEDGHPWCCSIRTTAPPVCSCWHEEVRAMPRRQPEPERVDDDRGGVVTDHWSERAECKTEDPEQFFPFADRRTATYQLEVRIAKDVCRRCPVRSDCLEWAMDNLSHGIAGGLTEEERAERRRRGGLPPLLVSPPQTKRETAEAVRAALRAGVSVQAAAQRYGVSVRAVERQLHAVRNELPDGEATA